MAFSAFTKQSYCFVSPACLGFAASLLILLAPSTRVSSPVLRTLGARSAVTEK